MTGSVSSEDRMLLLNSSASLLLYRGHGEPRRPVTVLSATQCTVPAKPTDIARSHEPGLRETEWGHDSLDVISVRPADNHVSLLIEEQNTADHGQRRLLNQASPPNPLLRR